MTAINSITYQSSPFNGVDLIHVKDTPLNFSKHYHLTYHIGLITHGVQSFTAKGRRIWNGPGQLQLMTPDTIHDGQSQNEKVSSRIFSVSHDFLAKCLELPSSNMVSFSESCIEDSALFKIFAHLHQVMIMESANTLWLEQALILNIETLIARHCCYTKQVEYVLGSANLNKLNNFMLDNLHQKMTLSMLAQCCDLSEPQLLRQFKKQTGMTPYAWLLRLRIEKALQLLRAGMRSTEVAIQVGFYDQAHFIHAFKRAYGVKPSELY